MASKSANTPRLVVIEGKDKGKVFPLSNGTVVIGRTKGDILIQDPRISRSHIALHFDDRSGRVSYTDLKSLNGTLVNGQPAEVGELKDGDRLQLGNTLFDCQIAPASESQANIEAPPDVRPSSRAASREPEVFAEKREPAAVKTEEPDDEPREDSSDRKKRERKREARSSKKTVPRDGGDTAEKPAARERKATGTRLLDRLLQPYFNAPLRTRKIALGALLTLVLVGYLATDSGEMPEEMKAAIVSIQALENEGKISQAIKEAEKLKEAYPDHSQPYLTLGALYLAQRSLGMATSALEKAHELSPEQPLAHVRLSRLYYRSGKKGEAEQELEHIDQLIRDGVNSKEFISEAGYLYLDLKEVEKALILSKALQNDVAPDDAAGYKLEAQVHFQKEATAQALVALEKGRTLAPKDEWILENLAFAKLSQKDVPGAVGVLNDWLDTNPEATKAMLVIAYLNYNEKKFDDAVPYLQRILKVAAERSGESHHPEALNVLGLIFQEQGKIQEAAEYFQQACRAGFQQSCTNELLRAAASPEGATPTDGAPAPESGAGAPREPNSLPKPGAQPARKP